MGINFIVNLHFENFAIEKILKDVKLRFYITLIICLGVFNGDYTAFEDKVRTLWFHMYERANGKLSSSGFEHVFIGKLF